MNASLGITKRPSNFSRKVSKRSSNTYHLNQGFAEDYKDGFLCSLLQNLGERSEKRLSWWEVEGCKF
jgi:hypothetical protein